MAEFIASKDQCLKFINQDLTFLQPSVISPIFGNTVQNNNSPAQISQLDSQVTSLTAVNLPTHVTKPKNSTPPTQTVEPVLDLFQLKSAGLKKNQNLPSNSY